MRFWRGVGFPCTCPGDSGQRPVRSSTLARTEDAQLTSEATEGSWGEQIAQVGPALPENPAGSYGSGRVRDSRSVPRAGFICPGNLRGATSGGPGSRPAQRFKFTTWSRVEEQGRLLALGQTPPRGVRSKFFRGLDSFSPAHGPAKPEPREGGEQGWESVGLSPTLRC